MSWAFRLPGTLESLEPDLDLLWARGCAGLWQDGAAVVAYFPARLELPLPGTWQRVDDQGYLARYYAELSPVRLETLVVAPTHAPLELASGQKPLWLDPGMAFGTGHHESTRLALEALEAEPLVGQDVLDVGSGSGILAIAADLLGAASARGLDIDPETVPVAEANARRNRSRATFACSSLEREAAASADLVVANLYAELHAQLAPAYRRVLRPGGRLHLSGILCERAVMVTDALSGFADLRTRQDGEWCLVTAARP